MRRLALVIVAAMFGGCSPTYTDSIERASTGEPQALLIESGIQRWLVGGTVPMCWHEFINVPSVAERDAAKNLIETSLREDWTNLLRLSLPAIVDCPTNPNDDTTRHVRIRLVFNEDRNHGTATVGMAALTTPKQRAIETNPPGYRVGISANWNTSDSSRRRMRAVALHEFGHTLGFAHEMNRPDGDSSLEPCYANPVDGSTYGPLDPTSIMGYGSPSSGYCATGRGVLSPGDVRAARVVYQTGRSGTNDFNSDGRADILWHNSSTHETQIWFMSGSSRIGRSSVLDHGAPVYIGPPYHIVGSADFNSDGRADILWHNSETGEIRLWWMEGANYSSADTILGENGQAALVGAPYHIVGTRDFNRDGKTDILWHNDSSGETQIWFMNGSRVVGRKTVATSGGAPILIGYPYDIVSANDFDGDGYADILWHNASTGEMRIWYLVSGTFSRDVAVLGETGATAYVGMPFYVVGTNDFNQDGAPDILWHNDQTGETQVWYMSALSRNRVGRRATVDAVLDPDAFCGMLFCAKDGFVQPPWAIMRH